LPLPPDDPYSTGFAATLCSDLCLWLEELSEEARAARIKELKKMDAPAIESENNVARNYYLLNNLGLSNAHKETLWGGTTPQMQKRKATTAGKRKAKRTKKQVEQEEPSEESDNESGSEREKGNTTGEPSNERKGAEKGRAAGKGRTAASSKAKGTGKWAETARVFLGNKPYGEGWRVLVEVWWTREEDGGFEGTVSSAAR
jgi:hypothetical protein